MRRNKQTPFEPAITDVLAHLASETPGTEEYSTMVEQLSKLEAMKNTPSSDRVSRDTLVTTAAAATTNILGILLVLHYEQINVVSSKAFAMIRKAF